MRKKRLTSLLVSIALLAVLIIFIAKLDTGEQTASVDSLRLNARFPEYKAEYLVENSFEYPVMINGKLRFKQEYALDVDQNAISAHIVTTEGAQKWLEGKAPKKIIVVKGKIINIVM